MSEDKTHDNVFVDKALTQMVNDAPRKNMILINSDNCSNQYKCVQHLQNLADENDATIIRIWSIAGHGKGEVGHVGGLSKVTIRRVIAGGQLIKKIDEMVDYLESKFSDKTYPRYVFRDISPKILEDKRMEDHMKKYSCLQQSNRNSLFPQTSTNASPNDIVDDWGQVIKGGRDFLEAQYLSTISEWFPIQSR